jgi:hypothetical protein
MDESNADSAGSVVCGVIVVLGSTLIRQRIENVKHA